jgi:hypothetical protein
MALIAALPGPASSVGFGIEVTPGKLEVSIPGGATYNLPITIRNTSPDQVHVQTSLVDFGVGLDGGYKFSKPGTRPYGLMRWAAVRPREFDLPPDSVEQVQLSIQIPQEGGLSGEYAGIAFFQTRPQRRAGNSIAFSVRVASKIYETIPGTVDLNGAIAKMAATQSSNGETYRVLFHNAGNTHVYLHGQLQIQHGSSAVDTVTLASGELVERGGDRLLEVHGKRLDPGSYQAIATVDYGGKTETGGEIAFDVH